MKDYTIIFIGKSGSGKGTQIELLTNFLQSNGEDSIYHLQSGQGLRDFISTQTYTSKHLENIPAQGKLIPTSIAIWLWVDGMIKNYFGQKMLFVDGAPRKLNEATIMDEMFDFYGRTNRYVAIIDVSDDWTKQRLKNRGRGDDINDESVNTRLSWFHQNSPEILSFFEKTGKYKIITVNGEQSMEEVQKELISKLEL